MPHKPLQTYDRKMKRFVTASESKAVTADGISNNNDIPKPTNDEMQKEYNYILARQMTKRLLDRGLISEEEFSWIMEKNKQSFSPFESRILRSNA